MNYPTIFTVTNRHCQFEKFWTHMPPSLKAKANKATAKLAYTTGAEDALDLAGVMDLQIKSESQHECVDSRELVRRQQKDKATTQSWYLTDDGGYDK